ncbi:glycoside hydrolase family 3 protein [Sediminibacterium roseum]|uniref:beta-glucosidase n=1 Tax=Sediminibacterium roseum TaxID=1978412 RepID=A0ABW9ZYG4_9BACT|nr:glycoside hydrolase family 3 protein [Sediminibacterium roseum]
MILAPVIDVVRHPRWSRTGETYGEDPYLRGLMGSAVVRGFQRGGVMATLKHFTAHGQSECGINQGPADQGMRAFRNAHMEPFRLVIQRVNPAGIMPAYVEMNGVPAHAK